jgi:hypothetical protein
MEAIEPDAATVQPLERHTEPMFSIPPAIQDTVLILEFVVGLDGHPERQSIRFIDARRGTRTFPQVPGFLDVVRDAVSQWQYQPGSFRGRPVRVLVSQPIIRRPPPPADSLPAASLLNRYLELSGCAPGVALTRVASSWVPSLTHVAAGQMMPAAQAPIR